MTRNPDFTDTLSLGAHKVTVREWVDPEDQPYEGTEPEDIAASKNWDGWIICTEASLLVGDQLFKGYSSLGGVWITRDRDGDNQLDSFRKEVAEEAVEDLKRSLRAMCDGVGVRDAVERQTAANAVLASLSLGGK